MRSLQYLFVSFFCTSILAVGCAEGDSVDPSGDGGSAGNGGVHVVLQLPNGEENGGSSSSFGTLPGPGSGGRCTDCTGGLGGQGGSNEGGSGGSGGEPPLVCYNIPIPTVDVQGEELNPVVASCRALCDLEALCGWGPGCNDNDVTLDCECLGECVSYVQTNIGATCMDEFLRAWWCVISNDLATNDCAGEHLSCCTAEYYSYYACESAQ